MALLSNYILGKETYIQLYDRSRNILDLSVSMRCMTRRQQTDVGGLLESIWATV